MQCSDVICVITQRRLRDPASWLPLVVVAKARNLTSVFLHMSFAAHYSFIICSHHRPDDATGREKKYFWRVYDKARGAIAFYIDGKDTSRANWMRYVLPAYRRSMQVQFPV